MLQEEMNQLYFEWLYEMICGGTKYNKLSYFKLLEQLNNIEFTYIVPRDVNRLKDGIDLRYRFAYDNGYSRNLIAEYIDNRPCSVLEMMVALAYRVEEQIMDDKEAGNRTGQWFWNMIVNLGLGNMHDGNFRPGYVYEVIDIFLNRMYDADGKGGLFTLKNCPYDLRDIEIWMQCMWYLDEIMEI